MIDHLVHTEEVRGSIPRAPTTLSIGYQTKGSVALALFLCSGDSRGGKSIVLAMIRPQAPLVLVQVAPGQVLRDHESFGRAVADRGRHVGGCHA